MAGEKFLHLNNGVIASKSSLQTSSGAGDAGKIPALNSAGKIDSTMLDQTPSQTFTAGEAISAGDFVNIYDDTGTLKVRKADNTSASKMAHGYAPAAISMAATGIVILGEGVNANLSSLTKGARYFLGTSGGVTTTAPTSTNTIVQELGYALSATELAVNTREEILNEA